MISAWQYAALYYSQSLSFLLLFTRYASSLGDRLSNGSPYAVGPFSLATLVYCGQTAGWISIPLGTEVVFGPSDIVSHGDPALPPHGKGHSSPPHFSAHSYCGQMAGWIIQVTTWYGGRPWPRRQL